MTVSLRTRLFVTFGPFFCLLIAAAAFGILSLAGARSEIQANLQRAEASLLAERASTLGSRLYRIVADAILNRDLESSQKAWTDAVSSERDLMGQLGQVVAEEDLALVREASELLEKLDTSFSDSLLPILGNASRFSLNPLIVSVDRRIRSVVASLSKPLETLRDRLIDGQKSSVGRVTGALDLLTWALAGSLALVALTWLSLQLILQRTVARPLGTAQKMAERIAAGSLDPLGTKFSIKEVAGLLFALNQIAARLAGQIATFREELGTMAGQSQELDGQLQTTRSALDQILLGLGALRSGSVEQRQGVAESSQGLLQMEARVLAAQGRIDQQSASMDESSAAVEELVGNVAAITKTVATMADLFTGLRQAAGSGKEELDEVRELVSQVAEQAETLAEANTLIAAIASQTNLLAMNAAIEAAHAGDAGRGFSVVADEIRKLAESATQQSQAIQKELERSTQGIQTVVVKTRDATGAFDKILGEMEGLGSLVLQTRESLAEQELGNRRVLESLVTLTDLAREVREDAAELTAGTRRIASQVTRVADLSGPIDQGFATIGEASTAIGDAVARAEHLSKRNVGAVEAATAVFQVD